MREIWQAEKIRYFENSHYPDTDPMGRLATKQQKVYLYVLQEGMCASCGGQLQRFEADHIREWSTGGKTETQNLQLLCPICHKAKTRLFLAKGNKS